MYLAIQSTYDVIELGIFNNQTCVARATIAKSDASRTLIPVLNELLITRNTSLKQLDFIAVNQGPAPFTTLRVILATINGIALSTNIPLIAVDALQTFAAYAHNKYKYNNTLVLLYAFGNDYYYALQIGNTLQEYGCDKIENILPKIIDLNNVCVIGNGMAKCKDILTSYANIHNVEHDDYPTLDIIAQEAYRKAQEHLFEKKVNPLYLKQALIR